MNKCIGPCLPHCFNKDQILYLVIGLILGYYLNSYLQKKKNNK